MRPIDNLLLALESGIGVRNYRRVLIDATPIFNDALHFNFICGLVIIRKYHNFLSLIH
jgi:hypothetical protein